MTPLEIVLVPALSDNYVYLAHDPDSGATAVIDPAEAAPVMAKLRETGWRLTHILNTHHHFDHIGGNEELKSAFGCTIVGPRYDSHRIPDMDVTVGDGDRYDFAGHVAEVFFVPGHTSGHIAYWFADSDALFCGDTLFALGCGRVFEGTAAQMWGSLARLRALPASARIYCGHEYTQSNARFALSVDAGNDRLQARAREIDAARARGAPTIPSLLGEELATNPFLRCDDPGIAASVGLSPADPVAVFAEVRRRKDNF